MKAVILVNPYLTEEAEFYQPRRIREELQNSGVSADILPNSYAAHLERGGLAETLTRAYDFCVYLDKDKYTPRILESRGIRLFNRADAVETCDDKMLTHIALAGAVPMPKTLFAPLCYKAGAKAGGYETIARELGFPLVVKECYGSLGEQVHLINGKEELVQLGETLKLRPHLFQEFIAESAGRDLRVICVGGKIAACMERRSEKDFRSNIGLGGMGTPFSPTDEIVSLAETVCKKLSLDYCGIDLLFGKEGMLVCEVNSNAFFGGIERVTGVNVARLYAEHMLRTMNA